LPATPTAPRGLRPHCRIPKPSPTTRPRRPRRPRCGPGTRRRRRRCRRPPLGCECRGLPPPPVQGPTQRRSRTTQLQDQILKIDADTNVMKVKGARRWWQRATCSLRRCSMEFPTGMSSNGTLWWRHTSRQGWWLRWKGCSGRLMVSEGGSGSCAHIVQGCQQYGYRGVLSFPPPIDSSENHSKCYFDRYWDFKRIKKLKFWLLDCVLIERYDLTEPGAKGFSYFL